MKRQGRKLLGMFIAMLCVMAMLTGCGFQVMDGDGMVYTATDENVVTDTEDGTSEDVTSEVNGGSTTENLSSETTDDVVVRIGGMAGPTSMGLVKLHKDSDEGLTANQYVFADLATEASAFVAPLSKGELDIAAVPSNLAAVLYNNTEGQIQVLAINNQCVLNIVERGEQIQSVADLKGVKLYATGEGATPEYTLRYILEKNGINPDSDLEIQWCADTTEALSYVAADEQAIAMLPQPFVTAALAQVEGLRVAIDLNDAWQALDAGCEQITGVIVVRKEFAESNKSVVDTFLQEYEASMTYTLEQTEEAAVLMEEYGIVGKAAMGKKALPGCHLHYEAGSEMKNSLEGFLKILYDANPASVGGSLPGEDFYYGL